MSHYLITGAQGGSTQGAVAPNRREINDLISDKVSFSLYIQALTAMFNADQSDSLSQFSLGGIHGLPVVQWEGSGGTNPVQGSGWGGYCTHGNHLFPTWHRPYVALYEQVMQQHAIDIAQQYQDQPTWSNAAQNLRAPYWDWATNSVPPPEVISLQTVNIITPDGNPTDVPNPLYQYTFHPIEPTFPTPYINWPTTIRHPDDFNSPSATTDVQALTDTLSSAQNDITTSIFNVLSRVNTWDGFSNHTAGDGGSSSNSLEAVHDEIHGLIGGDMGDPSVAGFDPIFFLHHCNVDRMLSLWAALHPNTWVDNGPAEGGTFTISGNATIGDKTPLTPFWETQTTYWTSSQTTATGNLRYSYPEFNGLDLGNTDAVQAAIANYVNQNYGGGTLSQFPGGAQTSLFAQSAPGGAQAPPQGRKESSITKALSAVKSTTEEITHQFRSRGGNPHTIHKPQHGSEDPNVIHDWTVRIHFKKYEIGGSFTALIFLGNVPTDPSHWRTCPTFVGAHYAFVNSAASQCNNCREQADRYVEGFVHLNSAIAARSGLSSLHPRVVVPYLKENLHWRIQGADRSEVDLSRLPSLEVTVVSTPLIQAPGSVFPIPGDAYYHHHITHGRPGGARQASA